MAKVSVDNISGETIVPVSEIQPGLTELAPNQTDLLAQHEQQVNDLFRKLPANQQNDPNINFFGSSFSGVDIKVIAHLYDTVNWRDKEIVDAQEEKAIADTIVDGCSSLIGGGLTGLATNEVDNVFTFDEKRLAFISATGLSASDPAQQQALNVLLRGVFRGGNFSFLGVARMRRECLSLRDGYGIKSTELEDKLKKLDQIKGDSSTTITLGTLQTISVQSHREKSGVRALGHAYAKGYTRGPRTIAGSMIFTIFDEHPLLALIRAMGNSRRYGERDSELTTLLADQLPPVDITIVFANEYGSLSDFRLYGLEFLNDATTFSIEDLLSEQVMNFVCRDADVMTSRGKVKLSRLQTGKFNDNDDKDVSGSSLLFDNVAYTEFLDKLKVRRRLKNR